MRKFAFIICLIGCSITVQGQRVLNLDSCRALALRNNKQVNVSRLSKEVAVNTRKATRTKALPKVDVVAGYQFSSRDINLLSKSQKTALSNIGTSTVNKITGDLSGSISGSITDLVTQGVITPDQAQQLGTLLQQMGNGPISQYASAFGNALGK